MVLQELHHLPVLCLDVFIHLCRVVAHLLIYQGPHHLVGGHLTLGQSLHRDHTVGIGKLPYSLLHTHSRQEDAHAQDKRFSLEIVHVS